LPAFAQRFALTDVDDTSIDFCHLVKVIGVINVPEAPPGGAQKQASRLRDEGIFGA